MDIKNAGIVLNYFKIDPEREEERINKDIEDLSESINEKIKELNNLIKELKMIKQNMKSHLNNVKLVHEGKLFEIDFNSYIDESENSIYPSILSFMMTPDILLRVKISLLSSNSDEEYMNNLVHYESK